MKNWCKIISQGEHDFLVYKSFDGVKDALKIRNSGGLRTSIPLDFEGDRDEAFEKINTVPDDIYN